MITPPDTRRPSRPLSAATLALALLWGTATSARAQQAPTRPPPVAVADGPAKLADADRHFRRGVELYDDGDMSAAQVEFSRAYQIVPHYKILYNLGQIAYQRQDYVQALDYFRRYLSDGHQSVPRERRRKVEQDILRIEQRIGRIEVSTLVDDEGAEILVDNVRMGTAPLTESIAVNVGQRKLELIRSSGQSVIQMVDVVGGETVRSVFAAPPKRLSPDAATADRVFGRDEEASSSPNGSRHTKYAVRTQPSESVAVAAAPSLERGRASSSHDQRRIPWLGWAASGTLLGGAAVTGGLAYSASRDLQQRREGYPLNPGDLDRPERRVRALALTTDGLLIGAVIATAISVYLTIRATSAASETAAAP